MTRAQLEGKYGIKIADDSYIHPVNGRTVRAYKMFSADGCKWENGLRTLRAVEAECRQWEKQLLEIKTKVEAKKPTWAEVKKQELLEKGRENWDYDDYEAFCYIEECEAEDARDAEYLGCYTAYC